MRKRGALAIAAALAGLWFTTSAAARITRFDILREEPAFGGAAFGAAGAYRHIIALAHGTLDPVAPGNALIQDLDLAPRNADGMVEYGTPVEILAPADPARGNRALLFEVVNRGNKLALANFNAAPPPAAARNALAAPGDGHLMHEGYSLVWWGWEMDVNPGADRLALPPIVARAADGAAITGIVRSEIVTPTPTPGLPLGLSQQIQFYPPDSFASYPTADTDNRRAFADGFLPRLTVRAHEQEPRAPIPNEAWRFASCAEPPADLSALPPDDTHLCLPGGFQPGRLYELIYRARDPFVLGIGFAATRDLGAFLRASPRDDAGAANPLYRPDQVALITGTSQSGRMLRSLIALGFNADAQGRRVFDGALPHIGGGLMPLNVRFGQPVRAWGQQTDHLYPAYDFPFGYARQADPLTGRAQGLLDRCTASATCPRLFHVATALELWEGRQSLGLTDPLGLRDVPDPPEVRSYIMASTQHAPAALPLPAQPPFLNCQQQPNPNPQLWTLRALLRDFTQWVRDDVAPPPSAVPRIAEGTLVAADQVLLPPIPANAYGGVPRPALSTARVFNPLHPLDFGPDWRAGDSSGVITVEPPRASPAGYGVLVPQVDADGNDVGGIRSVFLQVPLGTYTGWNLGRAGRFEGGMCNLIGSFVPFAATRAERAAAGDPRPSLEERYPDRDTYLAAFHAAAARLTAARFLLPEDAAALTEAAARDGMRGGP